MLASKAERTVAVLVEDDDMRAGVCRYLQDSRVRNWGAEAPQAFFLQMRSEPADLAVVDMGLLGDDALATVHELAAEGVAVAVLGPEDADAQGRMAVLDAGALQYFAKPANAGELAAGARTLLRYLHGQEPVAWSLNVDGPWLMAPNQRLVMLTSRELELLQSLFGAHGALVNKSELTHAMGCEKAEGGFHRIESLLTRLRHKTLDATGMPLPVRSVFGKGLVFMHG
ncbi:MAG: response regulator transcription factor [Comamonas sp.]